MRDFEIEQVSLNFKWIYKTIIPSLPVVGTEAFAVLCKKLSPFGLSASGIIADAPSNKLSDAQMTIFLLDNRLGIRFSVSSFEIITNDLLEGDEQIIADIGEIVFGALEKIDKDIISGSADINLRYHLKLKPNESKKILSEHLILANANPNLSPNMASYKVNLGEDSTMQNARVAIAESLAYIDSIFFDISIDYAVLEGFAEFAINVKNDVIKILNTFRLNGEILR
jgi:hypothetical protein